jgi:hypothetical protein
MMRSGKNSPPKGFPSIEQLVVAATKNMMVAAI